MRGLVLLIVNDLLFKMKKIAMLAAALLIGAASWSCLKETTAVTSGGQGNTFDFKTTETTNISVNYSLTDSETPLLFEVYTEYPFTSTNNRTLKADLEPALRAYVDAAGKFSGTVLLPSWCEQVYLHSTKLGLPDVIALPVTAGGISYTAGDALTVVSAGASRAAHTYPSDIYVPGDWSSTGKMASDNGTVNISGDVKSAFDVFQQGVSINKSHSNLLGKIPVVNITKNNGANRVTLTLVHSSGLDHSTLCYYSYPTATPPTSLAQVKNILALPNTAYLLDMGVAFGKGYSVDLKYWDGSGYVAGFPQGTSIGFFVIKDGFESATGNIVDGTRYYSNFDLTEDKQQIVAFGNSGNGIFIAGVETVDRNSAGCDNDFRDILFYVEPFPRNSATFDNLVVDPEPVPEPEPNYTEYKGTLIFEDLWPSAGDYDLNDVVVEYTSKVYVNDDNEVIKIEEKYVPVNNGAEIQSGFAVQYNVAQSAFKTYNFSTDFTPGVQKADYVASPMPIGGFESGQSKATVLFFDDIRTGNLIGKTFTVKAEMNSGIKAATFGYPPYNPFIVILHGVGADPRNRELHLPNYAPTPKASTQWFGVNADESNPPLTYYVSSENYPFAINLPIHGFVLSPETVRIDKTYSEYYRWAASYGQMNQKWYENP